MSTVAYAEHGRQQRAADRDAHEIADIMDHMHCRIGAWIEEAERMLPGVYTDEAADILNGLQRLKAVAAGAA